MIGSRTVGLAEDIAQRERRRRGLLTYAADCEREAWEIGTGSRAAELLQDAKCARLAAQALAVDA